MPTLYKFCVAPLPRHWKLEPPSLRNPTYANALSTSVFATPTFAPADNLFRLCHAELSRVYQVWVVDCCTVINCYQMHMALHSAPTLFYCVFLWRLGLPGVPWFFTGQSSCPIDNFGHNQIIPVEPRPYCIHFPCHLKSSFLSSPLWQP